MIVIKKYTFLLLLSLNLVLGSCQIKIDKQKEMYSVLSFLVNTYTGKKTDLPPPMPLYPEDKFTITETSSDKGIVGRWKSKKDSLSFYTEYKKTLNDYKNKTKNKKYIIAVEPYLIGEVANITIDSLFRKDYNLLLNELKKIHKNEKIILAKITPIKKNIIIEAPNIEELRNKRENWNKFDQIFNCSRIVFNKNYSKALAVIGVNRSRLDGFNALVLLERKNGDWVEVHSQLLTVS